MVLVNGISNGAVLLVCNLNENQLTNIYILDSLPLLEELALAIPSSEFAYRESDGDG